MVARPKHAAPGSRPAGILPQKARVALREGRSEVNRQSDLFGGQHQGSLTGTALLVWAAQACHLTSNVSSILWHHQLSLRPVATTLAPRRTADLASDRWQAQG